MRIEPDADIGTRRITDDKRVNIFYYRSTPGRTSSSSTSAWTGRRPSARGRPRLLLRALGPRDRGHLQGGEVPHPARRVLGQEAREDPATRDEAQATFAKWYIRTMNIFGRPGSPKNLRYRTYRLKTRDNDEVRQAFATEVAGLCEKVGLRIRRGSRSGSSCRKRRRSRARCRRRAPAHAAYDFT